MAKTEDLSVDEAAAFLKVSKSSVQRAVRRGDLRATQDLLARGQPLRFATADLREYALRRNAPVVPAGTPSSD
jgi:excisionase family DNA binding protein